MPVPVSLAVIALNEEKDLPACLESAKGLVSEMIVVDSGSTDATAETARAHGAKVIKRAFDGFSSQKKFSADSASFDWVLQLDADERVSPELYKEISLLFDGGNPPRAGYEIPYDIIFMGKRLKHSGTGSERHLRLFRKSMSRFPENIVHEGVEISGPAGKLSGKIIHRPYAGMEEYLAKLNAYTSLAAQKAHARGKKHNPARLLIIPFEFAKRYILRLGFLDGTAGLVWCALASFYVWLKSVKLMELEMGEARRLDRGTAERLGSRNWW